MDHHWLDISQVCKIIRGKSMSWYSFAIYLRGNYRACNSCCHVYAGPLNLKYMWNSTQSPVTNHCMFRSQNFNNGLTIRILLKQGGLTRYKSFHVRSKTLSFALRLLGFSSCSLFDGPMGFLVTIFPSGCVTILVSNKTGFSSFPEAFKNACFTILSSRLWKEIIAKRPPGLKFSMHAGIALLRCSNSTFTAILKAYERFSFHSWWNYFSHNSSL